MAARELSSSERLESKWSERALPAALALIVDVLDTDMTIREECS